MKVAKNQYYQSEFEPRFHKLASCQPSLKLEAKSFHFLIGYSVRRGIIRSLTKNEKRRLKYDVFV